MHSSIQNLSESERYRLLFKQIKWFYDDLSLKGVKLYRTCTEAQDKTEVSELQADLKSLLIFENHLLKETVIKVLGGTVDYRLSKEQPQEMRDGRYKAPDTVQNVLYPAGNWDVFWPGFLASEEITHLLKLVSGGLFFKEALVIAEEQEKIRKKSIKDKEVPYVPKNTVELSPILTDDAV